MEDRLHLALRAIYQLVKDEKDVNRLKEWYTVLDYLFEEVENPIPGVILDMRLWVGLLIDTPDMGDSSREGLVRDNPWLA